MDPRVAKAIRISDGLASLAEKKVKGFIRELEQEGALTKQEGQKVTAGLEKVKKALYDNVIGELKKLNDQKAKAAHSSKKTKK